MINKKKKHEREKLKEREKKTEQQVEKGIQF